MEGRGDTENQLGGVMQDAAGMVWDEDAQAWKDAWGKRELVIYDNGAEKMPLTPISSSGNRFVYGFYTTEKVDVSKISEVAVNGKGNAYCAAYFLEKITSVQSDAHNLALTGSTLLRYINRKYNSFNGEITGDISDISGSYYLLIGLSADSAASFTTIATKQTNALYCRMYSGSDSTYLTIYKWSLR